MSNKHSEDAEDFTLSLKWKPGADLMSKLLLGDPKVINVVVRSLVGTDVPANSYAVAQTEWADTKSVYTVYASQNANNDTFIPALTALQKEISQDTMLETIEYCTLVYEKFRLLPTVLIIFIKGCSSLKDNEEFIVDDDSFLVQCKSNFWAHKCFLFFS